MSLDQFLLSADTTDLNYPEVRPTLDLNFARVKALDPRITFTRASGGSYVGADGYIKFAGVNEARFDHDPYTGESLGLLVEESRTNLFEWSETFVSGWAGNLNAQVNTDTILNPYGVLGTVYYITVDEWYRTFNANGLSTLALSFFSKRRFGGRNSDYNRIEIFQQAVDGGSLGSYIFRFDGNNPNSGQFQNIRTERYQNDWYRFSCTLVARPDYNGGVFGPNARVDLEGQVADNYFWGIQVESGAFPTSYIPTIGSTRTRAADNASMTGKNFSSWYNPSEWTLVTRTSVPSSNLIASPAGVQYSSIDDGTSNNLYSIRYVTDTSSPYIDGDSANASGVPTFNFTGSGSNTLPNPVKSALAVKLNDAAFCYNGNTVEIDSSVTLSTSVNRLVIGGAPKAGTISQLSYFPKRLTNQQLQVLTR